jgi:CheY-like chemotaxis protein
VNAASDELAECRPCMILAHADNAYLAQALRVFRRRGWDVYAARTGPEARRLARMLQPQLVVLQADLPEESGWLTCEKLIRESPGMPVVLVTADPTPQHADFASFVGAVALADRRDGMAALLPHVREPALPAVG